MAAPHRCLRTQCWRWWLADCNMTNDGINVSDDVFIGEDDDGDGDNQQSSNGILACKQ